MKRQQWAEMPEPFLLDSMLEATCPLWGSLPESGEEPVAAEVAQSPGHWAEFPRQAELWLPDQCLRPLTLPAPPAQLSPFHLDSSSSSCCRSLALVLKTHQRDCCCSVAQSCLTLCSPMDYIAHQASLSFTISWNLPKLMSIELVMPSNHFIRCCPLLLLPSIFLSIRVFSNELALCIRWPKY